MKNQIRCLPLILFAAAPLLFSQTVAPKSDPLAPTRDSKSAVEIDREWQQSVSKYDATPPWALVQRIM